MAPWPGHQERPERLTPLCPVGRGLALSLSPTRPHGRLWDPRLPRAHLCLEEDRPALSASQEPPLPGGGWADWAAGWGAFGPLKAQDTALRAPARLPVLPPRP